MSKNKNSHYVDNEKLLEALVERKKQVQAAEESGAPPPKVSEFIGECIIQIASHLAYKMNFTNYTYRDEMINDAILNCVDVVDNFNEEKSSNPFAYFTTISYFAFIRRIKIEKKGLYIKYSIARDIMMSDDELINKYGSDPQFQKMDDFIAAFEESTDKKKQKADTKGSPLLDNLFVSEEEKEAEGE